MHARYWALWAVTHVLLIGLLLSSNTPYGDVDYYYSGFAELDGDALTEYPALGLALAHIVFLIAGSSHSMFVVAFIASCFLLDAFFFWLLLRNFRPQDNDENINVAALFWAMFVPAVGHVGVLRLDLVPALAVGAAALCLIRYPLCSSFFLAVATMMKLWPGILAAGLLSGWRDRGTYLRVVVFGISLFGLAAMVALTGGVQRLLSPLDYQSDRGLQIESIAATPFMVIRELFGGNYGIEYAASKSYEIFGAGVTTAISITTVLFGLTFVVAIGWMLSALVTNRWEPQQVLVLWLFLILLLMVANKVFSPQYIMWLGPLMAIILLNNATSTKAKTVAAVILGAAIVGQVVYPFTYDQMLDNDFGSFFPILALLIRNSAIVVITCYVGFWLWQLKTKPADLTSVSSQPAA